MPVYYSFLLSQKFSNKKCCHCAHSWTLWRSSRILHLMMLYHQRRSPSLEYYYSSTAHKRMLDYCSTKGSGATQSFRSSASDQGWATRHTELELAVSTVLYRRGVLSSNTGVIPSAKMRITNDELYTLNNCEQTKWTIHIMMWMDVNGCEQMWKMWTDVNRCERMWTDVNISERRWKESERERKEENGCDPPACRSRKTT
jgi:hypothetical protein